MLTVLLLYMLTATDHEIPSRPKFFAVYRTEAACLESVKVYMSLNNKSDVLVNAICEDAENPNLVPFLNDVPELEAIEEDNPNPEFRPRFPDHKERRKEFPKKEEPEDPTKEIILRKV